MRKVYLASDNIISPLGFSSEENIEHIRSNQTGIKKVNDSTIWSEPFFGAVIENDKLSETWKEISNDSYTKLEKMMLLSISKLLVKNHELDINKCGIIISTTKGNIDSLGSNDTKEKAYLASVAKTIQQYFSLSKTPIVLSNACISGGLAIAIGKRMLQSGLYDDMVVVGGDLLSEFTLSGFYSFQAVSSKPCKPFCKNRTGISLGEAAASVWLSVYKKQNATNIQISGDASANDANHISGPSRTGEGLYISIEKALKESGLTSDQIDYVSAHGTATPFNDEMEAIAFNRAKLQNVPVNSLKGYYGHTLGASALIESIVARHCLINNELFASIGFEELGVSQPINVIKENTPLQLNRVLKTASGFGGCNVALVIEKVIS